MIGTESDACRAKLRAWIKRLHADFDPGRRGADCLHEGLLRMLDDREERIYNADMRCWTFLGDVHEETQQISSDIGLPVNIIITRPCQNSSSSRLSRV